ncbi:MAG: hypothetical protein KJO08_07650 [Gammaproteobacteria bacterium]|nr:hypothetical protein [Gammaproteobacteria bacterium]
MAKRREKTLVNRHNNAPNPTPGSRTASEKAIFELWQGLGKALVFLAVSVIASTAMTLGAFAFFDRAKAQHAIQEKHLDETRTRYRQLDRELAIVETYFPRFQHLVEAGFIGEEHRLTWLEALRNAARRLQLPELDYDISSRQPYHVPNSSQVPRTTHTSLNERRQLIVSHRNYNRRALASAALDTGPYRIHASEMQLTMGLLHEGDLFSLLAELDRHAVGGYSVEYCRLRRVGREPSRNPTKANLNADCVLRWYSLDKRRD